MMIRVIVVLLVCSTQALAQKEIKIYYDAAKRYVKEDYFVATENDQLLEGPYKRYYSNGKVEMEGLYKNGYRSGTFLEYFPDGMLKKNFLSRWHAPRSGRNL